MDIRIDLTDVDTPAQARARLSEALPLPENRAWNLDALYDFLTERAVGWRVIFTGCAGAEERLPCSACARTPRLRPRSSTSHFFRKKTKDAGFPASFL